MTQTPPEGAAREAIASTEAMLCLRGVSKAFGATRVVDDLSFAVAKGEFVSILGPSGCGKTTTLRMIAGFIDADAGDLMLDGKRINDVPSHKRGAAMVFQNYALFPHMSVFDNVAFGLRMRKVARAEVARRVGDGLALVQLPHLAARYPRELSGGQQQRVALARAVVLNPKLLLLDEPLSNLDAKLRKELRTEFLDIHRRSGITTLFVTHDLEEAFAVSDRVAVMNKGCLEQFAKPTDIFSRPRTRFVADFVGHVNFIDGRIDTAGGVVRLVASDGFTVRASALAATSSGTAQFVVPNHRVRIGGDAQGRENVHAAVLESLHYVGSTVHFVVRIGARHFAGEAYATPQLLSLSPGGIVDAGWDGGDMIALPAADA